MSIISDEYFDSDCLSDDVIMLIESYANIQELDRDEAYERIVWEWQSCKNTELLKQHRRERDANDLEQRVITLEKQFARLIKIFKQISQTLDYNASAMSDASGGEPTDIVSDGSTPE